MIVIRRCIRIRALFSWNWIGEIITILNLNSSGVNLFQTSDERLTWVFATGRYELVEDGTVAAAGTGGSKARPTISDDFSMSKSRSSRVVSLVHAEETYDGTVEWVGVIYSVQISQVLEAVVDKNDSMIRRGRFCLKRHCSIPDHHHEK